MPGRRHCEAPIGAQRPRRPQPTQPPSFASAASSSARFGCVLSLGIDAGAGAASALSAAPQVAPVRSVRVTDELQAVLSVQLRAGEVMTLCAVAGSGKSTAQH